MEKGGDHTLFYLSTKYVSFIRVDMIICFNKKIFKKNLK